MGTRINISTNVENEGKTVVFRIEADDQVTVGMILSSLDQIKGFVMKQAEHITGCDCPDCQVPVENTGKFL